MADAHQGVKTALALDMWQDGYGRGYQEGRLDGERLGALALRTDLVEHLSTMACDLRLGLRHDLETPGAVVQSVLQMVQGAEVSVSDGSVHSI